MSLIVWLSLATFVSTLLGGLTALRHKTRMDKILGFTAGVLLGVVAFDVLPEIFNIVSQSNLQAINPMIALVAGFLVFHTIEKSIVIQSAHEEVYAEHGHPKVGVASALALSGHSLLDGIGIGLAFQAGTAVGITVALAVIAHDFSDGLNTITLMLSNNNSERKAIGMLLLDATTPIIGVASTMFFHLPDSALVLYLGFFAGFLLYIGASDILPAAHSKQSSYGTIALTGLGALFIFVVTRFTF